MRPTLITLLISICYIFADNLCKLCGTPLCLINFIQVDVSRIVQTLAQLTKIINQNKIIDLIDMLYRYIHGLSNVKQLIKNYIFFCNYISNNSLIKSMVQYDATLKQSYKNFLLHRCFCIEHDFKKSELGRSGLKSLERNVIKNLEKVIVICINCNIYSV